MGRNKTENKPLEITEKLKVLCLHGYRQNADSFKSKIGSFRKFVQKYADFTFVEAPHQAPALPDADLDESHKSWWFNKEDGTFKGTNKCGPAFGFEDSLRLVEKIWKEQGPFQGLLGFSQGACFAGLICHLAENKKTSIRPEFAILCAGFRSGSLAHVNYYQSSISIPTLHIYGETDDIISNEMSLLLASQFENKDVITHRGGHYFPATAEQKQKYIEYFQDRLQSYLEAKVLKSSNPADEICLEEQSDDDESD